MQHPKLQIIREDGTLAEAQAPVIVSASRSTDIPAFYADWFFHRLRVGYSAWTNPFNGKESFVSYQNTRFIVFWSKNPRSLLPKLEELKKRGIGCYIQFTLNDYEEEGFEKGVPPLQERIDTFRALVDKQGLGAVVWRFDPLLLTEKVNPELLLAKIEKIGDQLKGYTEKLVFSFADILYYHKVKTNLEKNHIDYREWKEDEMTHFATELAKLNQKWNFQLATCAEKISLQQFGIAHNKCVDDDLIVRLAYQDKILMNYLKVTIEDRGLFSLPQNAIALPNGQMAVKHKGNKDSGQRQFCGCIASKDIGEYNTCPHLCEYCYANSSKEAAVKNQERHKARPMDEKIK